MAHKFQGNDGCLSGSESLLSESTRNSCSSVCTQYDNSRLSQQDGGIIQDSFRSEPPDLGLVHREDYLDNNSLWSRETEHCCRQLSCLLHQSTRWSLNHSIFSQVVAIYGPPQADLFASAQNHQVRQNISWLPDQNAIAVDAFSFPWQTLDLIYLFPPISLILKCLQMIKADKLERALLVAPV